MKYYVYAYLREDGTPYYIGKGHGNRAWDWHRNIPVPKDKERIVMLETNLTELGAFAIERRMIRWYGRKDSSTGILRNMSDGGEGVTGYTHTAETRAKLSKISKGKVNSAETRAKMSAAQKGRVLSKETRAKISEANRTRIVTDETRDKMSATRKGRPGHKNTPEIRAKLSATLKGRARTEEHKTKTSQTMKEYWARKKALALHEGHSNTTERSITASD
jgi:hypothetical protein